MKDGRSPVGRPILLRLLVATAALTTAGAVLEAAQGHPEPRRIALLLLLEGVILVAWIADGARHHPVLPVLMAAAGILALSLSSAPLGGFGLLMALLSAGGRLPLRRAVAFAAPVLAVFELVELARGQKGTVILFEVLGSSALFVLAAGYRQLIEERGRTRAALAELERAQELQVRAARVAERVRLAGQVHEALADTFMGLTAELEAIQVLLIETPGGAAPLAAAKRAHRLTRQGMEETRRAAGTLRGERLPGPALLATLVSDFERDSGIQARLRVEGEPLELAPESRLALYRTAQEALSGVWRRGLAAQVQVCLRYDAEGAELSVENDCEALAPAVPAGDLSGIRERAELLGGRLEAAFVERGFRVRLWVPAGTLAP